MEFRFNQDSASVGVALAYRNKEGLPVTSAAPNKSKLNLKRTNFFFFKQSLHFTTSHLC